MNAIHALSQLSYSPMQWWRHANNSFQPCQYHIDKGSDFSVWFIPKAIGSRQPKISIFLGLVSAENGWLQDAGVVKLVDALDSKSSERKLMSVRFRPPAPQ